LSSKLSSNYGKITPVKNKLDKISTIEILAITIVLLIAFIGYGWYYYSTQEAFLGERISELENSLETTTVALNQTENEKTGLANDLVAEQERVGSLANQVGEITGTVDDLEKLNKLDKELLQKYSKVFFLNEHYVPDSLRNIPLEHLYDESIDKQIDSRVWPQLRNMIEDAADDGVTLWIVSAYRSFGTQSSLKATYKITYGSGANAFSADQGYSEHQLGTTIDFTTMGIGGGFSGFSNTEAYEWLKSNAYKYGFTLSYPEGNAYYIFEPWHWRFVGQDLARDLHFDDKHFYDLLQRDIDKYLLEIFD